MMKLYEDPHFTFRFAVRVSVYKIDPSTGERLGLLVTATVSEGGWVDVAEPIIVRAGDAFIAVPEKTG